MIQGQGRSWLELWIADIARRSGGVRFQHPIDCRHVAYRTSQYGLVTLLYLVVYYGLMFKSTQFDMYLPLPLQCSTSLATFPSMYACPVRARLLQVQNERKYAQSDIHRAISDLQHKCPSPVPFLVRRTSSDLSVRRESVELTTQERIRDTR
jgi:hypothetical protein